MHPPGERTGPDGDVARRFVIAEKRGFSVLLDAIGEKPAHLRMESDEGEIASGLAEERAPRMAPSPRQSARPAVAIEPGVSIGVRLRAGRRQMEDERQQNASGGAPDP
jgi:hypothetical protein